MRFEVSYLFAKQTKKLAKKYPKIKEDLQNFINTFEDYHSLAKSIKNCVFKIRVANSDKQSGKRGRYRIYYYYKHEDIVYLLAIYDKSSIEMINENIVFQEIKKFIEQEGF